jgi:hypothetical protein
MKLHSIETWVYGLFSALIGGAATAVSMIVVDPMTYNLHDGWRKLIEVALVSGIMSAAFYLKQSPLPKDEDEGPKLPPPVKLAALAALLGLVCGCATVRDGADAAKPYLSTGADLACSAVLQLAVSDGDRVEKAKYIYSVAACVRSLSGGNVPTPAELGSAIALWAPEKSHWADLASTLQSIYGDQFNRIDGDPRLALEVLEQIARGCELAASRIIPAQ